MRDVAAAFHIRIVYLLQKQEKKKDKKIKKKKTENLTMGYTSRSWQNIGMYFILSFPSTFYYKEQIVSDRVLSWIISKCYI